MEYYNERCPRGHRTGFNPRRGVGGWDKQKAADPVDHGESETETGGKLGQDDAAAPTEKQEQGSTVKTAELPRPGDAGASDADATAVKEKKGEEVINGQAGGVNSSPHGDDVVAASPAIAAESSHASAAPAKVSGGNFGADEIDSSPVPPPQQQDPPAPAKSSDFAPGTEKDGDSHVLIPKKLESKGGDDDDDSFLEQLALQHELNSSAVGGLAVVNTVSTISAAERPKSAKSNVSGKSSKSRGSTSEPGQQLPILYLRDNILLELVSDKGNNPIRLDNHETYDVLWTEESQTISQLQEILSTATEVSRELYDCNIVKRKVIESQGKQYLLVGSMRDFDQPDGNPIQLLDPDTELVVWDHFQWNAKEEWDILTKHARMIGTHNTALRMLLDFRGTKIETVEDEFQEQDRALIEHESRHEIWNKFMPDAASTYDSILNESDVLGRIIQKWVDQDPPPPASPFTTIDLVHWQCECLEGDKIVFTWLGSKDKTGTPKYGAFLSSSTRKAHMQPTIVVKAANRDMRSGPDSTRARTFSRCTLTESSSMQPD